MNKSIFREVSISLIIAILIILALEGVSRIIYTPSHLDKIMAVLEENHSRFWKVKSNLHQDFFGAQVSTDSRGFRIGAADKTWSSAKMRVALMGASPSFGWGVSNQETYCSKISTYSDNHIATRNFSQIGYSSYQGTKLIDEVIKSKPTHILISYVINDLDYYRFFYSDNVPDKEVQAKDQSIITLRNFAKGLIFPKLFFKFLKSNQSSIKLDRETRVTKEDYISNINSLVEKIKSNNITPILIKFPVNMPLQENTEGDIQKIQNARIRKRGLEYNLALQNFANEKSIKLIDLTEVVRTTNKYLFLDPNGDTIHPNIEGHDLFAKKILKSIL
ncbi:hypothetical protein BIY24_15345 [Halobacteriovorax marinus]|uniref:SGNH/GDSL hydrolase family protein n=1 Tax=Halobacteriovorax marinus TaxID=97084 RepID=UPI000BC3155B|nr:GDSL-type esterase/lipase family protein [Halobacteriovorax marinus]ATH09267.1 hypothetical protein BIY24_15345 [Halobacteriovorax marinus]